MLSLLFILIFLGLQDGPQTSCSSVEVKEEMKKKRKLVVSLLKWVVIVLHFKEIRRSSLFSQNPHSPSFVTMDSFLVWNDDKFYNTIPHIPQEPITNKRKTFAKSIYINRMGLGVFVEVWLYPKTQKLKIKLKFYIFFLFLFFHLFIFYL